MGPGSRSNSGGVFETQFFIELTGRGHKGPGEQENSGYREVPGVLQAGLGQQSAISPAPAGGSHGQ